MATNNADNFSNPIAVSTGGTGVASFTTYAPLTGGTNSTGPLQQAPLGASGSFLRSAGASALPVWQSSGMVLLSSQSVSAVSAVNYDNTLITSTYKTYFVDLNMSLSGANTLSLRISTDNGSTIIATNYQSARLSNTYNATTLFNFPQTTVGIISDSVTSSAGYLFISLPTSKSFSYVGKQTLGAAGGSRIYGKNSSTTTVNYLNFSVNTGTMTGTISLYGLTA